MTELMKDILREPEELAKSLAYTVGPGQPALAHAAEIVKRANHVYITGIGSSWHAGMAVASVFLAAGRPASLVDASELVHFTGLAPNSVIIVLSRSGRSTEIVQLLGKAKAAGTSIVAITNTPDSPLALACDALLRLEAAFDHLVSITMYSALTLVGGLLAREALKGIRPDEIRRLEQSLAEAANACPRWRNQVQESDWFEPYAPAYFLARGGSLASCHEARLVWEEAAKTPACAQTTGGFRHGPQEITRPGLRVGLWLDGRAMRSQDFALAADLRTLGAKTMIIGQHVPRDAADLVLEVPEIAPEWQFLIDIIPAQIAAEHLSRLNGVDCDSFRICPYVIEDEGGLIGHANSPR